MESGDFLRLAFEEVDRGVGGGVDCDVAAGFLEEGGGAEAIGLAGAGAVPWSGDDFEAGCGEVDFGDRAGEGAADIGREIEALEERDARGDGFPGVSPGRDYWRRRRRWLRCGER